MPVLDRFKKETSPAPPPRTAECLNCGSGVNTPYCPQCGQKNEPLQLGVGDILQDALEEFLRFDAKLYQTLKPLLTKPGFLTAEWAAGRRTKYITPMKLYLTSAFVFFLLAFNQINNVVNATGQNPSETFVEGTYTGHPISQFFQRGVARLDHLGQASAVEAISERLPTALFLMLPLFAFCLKLVYVRRNRYYAEHLVFALHLHAFYFIVLTLLSFVPKGDPIGFLICVIYSLMALSRYYGQGPFKTLVKSSMLGCGYSILLGLTIFGALFFGIAMRPAQKPSEKQPPEKPAAAKSDPSPGKGTSQ